MSDGDWIVIPNWERFQHYRDRRPLWIKVYVSLLDDPDFLGLTDHQRGLLFSLWLLYASSGCQVRANTASLSRQINGRVSSVQLKALSDAGFIELSASRPLAKRYLRERERERPPISPKKKPGPNVTGWRFVRGSHGTSYVRDPAGTDRPPAGYG